MSVNRIFFCKPLLHQTVFTASEGNLVKVVLLRAFVVKKTWAALLIKVGQITIYYPITCHAIQLPFTSLELWMPNVVIILPLAVLYFPVRPSELTSIPSVQSEVHTKLIQPIQ